MIIGDLMRENPIPVDLEAALLRAAALIPGIKLLGENERLLERKNYVDGDPGELISGAAVMESGVVGSMTALP